MIKEYCFSYQYPSREHVVVFVDEFRTTEHKLADQIYGRFSYRRRVIEERVVDTVAHRLEPEDCWVHLDDHGQAFHRFGPDEHGRLRQHCQDLRTPTNIRRTVTFVKLTIGSSNATSTSSKHLDNPFLPFCTHGG